MANANPKMPRLSVPMPQELLDLITEDANRQFRTPSKQVLLMLQRYIEDEAYTDQK